MMESLIDIVLELRKFYSKNHDKMQPEARIELAKLIKEIEKVEL